MPAQREVQCTSVGSENRLWLRIVQVVLGLLWLGGPFWHAIQRANEVTCKRLSEDEEGQGPLWLSPESNVLQRFVEVAQGPLGPQPRTLRSSVRCNGLHVFSEGWQDFGSISNVCVGRKEVAMRTADPHVTLELRAIVLSFFAKNCFGVRIFASRHPRRVLSARWFLWTFWSRGSEASIFYRIFYVAVRWCPFRV